MYKLHFLFFFLFVLSSINSVRPEEAGPLTEEVLVKGINAFGCNLLNGLYKDAAAEDNILVSPVNTYVALALLHLGAANKTRDELSTVMKLSGKDTTEIHQQLKSVVSTLMLNKGSFDDRKFHEVAFANGMFVQKDFSIKDSYLELTKKYYNSMAKNEDFKDKPQESTDDINKWISDSTKGRIAKFYDNPLGADTIAVLTSALYFNAKWKNIFKPEDTKKEKFNTGLTEIEVPMMKKSENLLHYVNDDTLHYSSVSLPYTGGDYEMTIYLQHVGHGDHGSLAHLFHQLAEKNFDSSNGSNRYVNLKLPKMKFSWKKSVVDALPLKDIFNRPDLGEMTTAQNVKVSDMIHATELEVDENGTIATAATAIEMILFSAPVVLNREPVNFYVDRPFLLTIKHTLTKTILFAGIVRKPM